MRIGFVLIGYGSYNGPEATAKNLLTQISERADEVCLITMSRVEPGDEWFLSENVDVRPVIDPKNPVSLFTAAKELNSCDIGHIPAGPFKLILPLLARTDIPMIIGNSVRWNSKAMKAAVKIFDPYLWANNLHHWKQFAGNDRMAFIPHGIRIDRFPSEPRKIDDKPRILWLNHLNEHKNPLLAIDASEQMTEEAHLTICGDGPLKEEVEQAASSLGNCTYGGFVPHESVSEAYASAHISLMTSKYEGSSHVAIESMASSLPLVTSTEFYSNVLGTGHSIKTDPDPDQLAAALDEMVLDDELRREMGENAREHVEQNFNIKIFGEEMYNFYEEVAKGNEVDYTDQFLDFYAEALEGRNLVDRYLLEWPHD